MKTIKKHRFLRVGLGLLTAVCAFFGIWSMKSEAQIAQAAAKTVTMNAHIGDMLEAKDYRMYSAGENVYAEGMRIV